jgi:hypothetical protein
MSGFEAVVMIAVITKTVVAVDIAPMIRSPVIMQTNQAGGVPSS